MTNWTLYFQFDTCPIVLLSSTQNAEIIAKRSKCRMHKIILATGSLHQSIHFFITHGLDLINKTFTMFSIHLCAEAACAEEQRRPACASAMRSRKKIKTARTRRGGAGSGAVWAGSGGQRGPAGPFFLDGLPGKPCRTVRDGYNWDWVHKTRCTLGCNCNAPLLG